MNAQIRRDEDGLFYVCGFCLADHEGFAIAERCCSKLVMPDLDLSVGRRVKPLTEKQVAAASRGVIDREAFIRKELA